MRRSQHDGIGSLPECSAKQRTLLLDVIGFVGDIVADDAAQTLRQPVGPDSGARVSGIAALLGKHSQPIGRPADRINASVR